MTESEANWGARLAKRYYDKLFKEYCIVDLTKYKQNVYAMRWRTEKELFSGKGQFECGNKYCKSREQLSSWEVGNYKFLIQISIGHSSYTNFSLILRILRDYSILTRVVSLNQAESSI